MLTEIVWPITGGFLRRRDGYRIFAALSRCGWIEHADPLCQLRIGTGELALRLPPDRAASLLEFSGCTVEGASLGVPSVRALQPSQDLRSWLVTIKGKLCDGSLREACLRQLDLIGVSCRVTVGRRQVIDVAAARVVGYAVRLSGLSEADSLAVQSRGLGGRQRFGCGVFEPC